MLQTIFEYETPEQPSSIVNTLSQNKIVKNSFEYRRNIITYLKQLTCDFKDKMDCDKIDCDKMDCDIMDCYIIDCYIMDCD